MNLDIASFSIYLYLDLWKSRLLGSCFFDYLSHAECEPRRDFLRSDCISSSMEEVLIGLERISASECTARKESSLLDREIQQNLALVIGNMNSSTASRLRCM